MSILPLEEIARLEEQRQAKGLASVAPESREIAGGVMARATPGLWTNNAVGLGLFRPVTRAEVDALALFHSEPGSEPRIEVCPHAHPSLLEHLAQAGFRAHSFETLFFRELHAATPVTTAHPAPASLLIRPVNAADPAEVREFARVSASGFIPEGQPILDDFLAPAITMATSGTVTPAAAWLDGTLVGAGFIDARPPVAGLFGLTVLPDARRMGIQQALLAWRLNLARSNGCILATIGGKPGEGTERNVRRMGFQVAYSRVIMTRPGPGLAPVAS